MNSKQTVLETFLTDTMHIKNNSRIPGLQVEMKKKKSNLGATHEVQQGSTNCEH